MDKHERDVLRRKKPILADVLDFSQQSQGHYRDMGLLTDDMLAEILLEKTDYGRTLKWIDLAAFAKKDALRHLMDMLITTGYAWVADELQADLLAEKGDMRVEEYIYREAGQLVHKHFGSSKRVGEMDKKAIQRLIALRYQAAKEAWRRQLEKEKHAREDALRMLQEVNSRMKGLTEKIKAFMRVQKHLITPYAHDMENALQLTREDPDPESTKQDYLQVTDDTVDETLRLLSSLLFDKERRDEERKRCLEVIKCEKQPTVELDIVVQEALRRAIEKADYHENEATVNEKLAASLDSLLKRTQQDMERELTEKERQIIYIESVLSQRDSRIRALEKQTMEMKAKLDDVESELDNWRQRCGLVEKTRRLGYYFPGWYDKLYFSNADGIDYDRKKKNWLSRSDNQFQRTPTMLSMSRGSGSSSARKPLKIVKRPLSQAVFKNKRDYESASIKNDQVTARSKIAIEYRPGSNGGGHDK